MKKLFILVVLALFGCSQKADTVQYQRRLTHFTVHLELADQNTTIARCVGLRTWGDVVPVGTGPYGCNAMDLNTNTATIYATEPQTVDDAYTTLLGHELLHAYAGVYHPGTN